MEIFKMHPVYSSYEISNAGIVRKNGKILKQHYDKGKYKRVSIIDGGVVHTKLVHQLVAQTFIPNPENKPQVNHINFKRDDNNLSNLEWATAEENQKHSKLFRSGWKLKPREIQLAKHWLNLGYKRHKIAQINGISLKTLYIYLNT